MFGEVLPVGGLEHGSAGGAFVCARRYVCLARAACTVARQDAVKA